MARQIFTKEQAETLPAELKAMLKPEGEGFVFEFETQADVAGLKTALANERTNATKHKNDLAALQAALGGVSADEAQKVLDDAKKAKEDAAKVAGKWDEYKTQLLTEVEEKRIKPLEIKAQKLERSLAKALVSDRIRAAVDKQNPKAGAADVLLPHAAKHVQVLEDEQGNFVARVFMADGKTPRVNAKGEFVSFEEYIETDFRKNETFGLLFNPNGTGGSGTPAGGTGNGNSGAKTMQRGEWEKLSGAESSKFFSEGGKVVD